MPFDRRAFLSATSTALAALVASGCHARGGAIASAKGYGALVPDPNGMLDLPRGFSYRVLSRLGDRMSDGGTVPDAADGMGCFDLGGGKLALVRNHELKRGAESGGAAGAHYDADSAGAILPGGTTTLVLDAATLKVERQFRSLAGTIRNCAGGTTPWGSWLSCEEDVTVAGSKVGKDHGWVFEVPAAATGPVDPMPLKALGRFNHEAACVDPVTGYVYLTEDRDEGLLYRFIPRTPRRLAAGGTLQALALADPARGAPAASDWVAVRWLDLYNVESPKDDLRFRGAAAGALPFARGEGIHMGAGELYFACTSGGNAGLGQIFRLAIGPGEDRLQLFFESTDKDQFNYGDNLTIAPDGQLVVCEDQYTAVTDNHLRGLTRDGHPYPLARVAVQTEPAGACFSPDGRVLFVNLYSPAMTLAVTGPWAHLNP